MVWLAWRFPAVGVFVPTYTASDLLGLYGPVKQRCKRARVAGPRWGRRPVFSVRGDYQGA